MRAALLTMLQKMAVLAAESMVLDQEDTKAAQGWRGLWLLKLTPWPRTELAALKGSNVFAPTSLPLETARQEIANLKARLDANLFSLGQWSPGLLSWRKISSWAAS